MNEIGKQSVLVIDDDPMNRKLLRTVLERKGNYIVHEAEDAFQGFKMAHERRPDIILLDIQMPGIDGLSATRIIKAESSLKDIPIVAVSANTMDRDKQEAFYIFLKAMDGDGEMLDYFFNSSPDQGNIDSQHKK